MHPEKEKILVLGLGNLLMGDEGVGIHVIRQLQKIELPDHVVIEDGGTGGFHLLSLIQSFKKIILIDAAIGPGEVGTINVLQPKFSKDFPKSLSSHDIGLKDLIDAVSLMGPLPEITLITVTVNDWRKVEIGLTPEVNATVNRVAERVQNKIHELDMMQ